MSDDSLIDRLRKARWNENESEFASGVGHGLDIASDLAQQEAQALVKELEDRKPKSRSGTSREMDTERLVIDDCIDIIRERLGGKYGV